MEIKNLTTKKVNQNGYHKNLLTQNKIGGLFLFPNGYIPDDCLACDGFVLKIDDYLLLYDILGKAYNDGTEATDEFRIPDYNISGRFLQPGSSNFGSKKAAGLPNIDLALRVDAGAKVLPYYANSYMSEYSGDDYGGTLTALTNGNDEYMFQMSKADKTKKAGDLIMDTTIYGKSTTVQPPSQIIHVCIKYK